MAKIMIIDDADDMVLLLSIIIKMEGHESLTLTTPVDIMQKLEAYDPALIIIDVNLGDYNGKEICKNIKSTPAFRNIPVLLTSGSARSLADHKDFNADGILEKPFELPIFIEKINELLNKKS